MKAGLIWALTRLEGDRWQDRLLQARLFFEELRNLCAFLNDSKQLSAEKAEQLYDVILSTQCGGNGSAQPANLMRSRSDVKKKLNPQPQFSVGKPCV